MEIQNGAILSPASTSTIALNIEQQDSSNLENQQSQIDIISGTSKGDMSNNNNLNPNFDQTSHIDLSQNQSQKRQAQDFESASNSSNQYQQKRQRTGNYNSYKNNGGNSGYNNYNNNNRNGKIDLRILLPSKDAGAIIGRGGSNIKKLRQEHKTQIQVPDCNGPERLLLISGDMETAINTILDIIPLLEENQKLNNSEQATEVRLLVHQSQAGCVIGRGGDKIKDLRIKHNLDMKVYSECAPMSTERICQMKGKPQDIVNCIKEVLELLETAPPKGMSRPYDPHNFDEFLSSQYGGYTGDKRSSGMNASMASGNMGGGNNLNNQQNNRRQSGVNMQNNMGMNRNGSQGPRGGNMSGVNNQRGSGNFSFNNSINENSQRGGRGGMMSNRGNGRQGGSMDRQGGRGNASTSGGNGTTSNGRGGIANRGTSHQQSRGGRGGGNFGNRGGFQANSGDNTSTSQPTNYGQSQQQSQYRTQSTQNNNSGGLTAGGNYGSNNNNISQQQSYQQSQNQNSNIITNQVTIPNDLAGAIIGPKGQKIQQIREQSGAGITIDKPIVGSNDRIITISGTPEQIQNAQYLLQLTVKQSGLWQGQ